MSAQQCKTQSWVFILSLLLLLTLLSYFIYEKYCDTVLDFFSRPLVRYSSLLQWKMSESESDVCRYDQGNWVIQRQIIIKISLCPHRPIRGLNGLLH